MGVTVTEISHTLLYRVFIHFYVYARICIRTRVEKKEVSYMNMVFFRLHGYNVVR